MRRHADTAAVRQATRAPCPGTSEGYGQKQVGRVEDLPQLHVVCESGPAESLIARRQGRGLVDRCCPRRLPAAIGILPTTGGEQVGAAPLYPNRGAKSRKARRNFESEAGSGDTARVVHTIQVNGCRPAASWELAGVMSGGPCSKGIRQRSLTQDSRSDDLRPAQDKSYPAAATHKRATRVPPPDANPAA